MRNIIFLVTLVLSIGAVQGNTLKQELISFVEVYNTNEKELIKSFIEKKFISGIDADLETNRWLWNYKKYGPLQFHTEVNNEDLKYRAYFQGKLTKAWVELTLLTSEKEPGKIRRIPSGYSGELRPARYSVEKIRSLSELTKHLDKYVTILNYYDYFSGSILISSNGKIIYEVHAGEADKSSGKLLDENSMYNIASVTKMFTSLGIMQLVEQRKVNLDHKLNKYVINYPDSISSRVSIRHLLTYTSGIGRGEFDAPIGPQKKRTIDEYLPLTIAPFESHPGKYPSYGNGGHVLLGAVIEVVSRMSYYDYIDKFIFQKADMTKSDFLTMEDDSQDKVRGYTYYRRNEEGKFYIDNSLHDTGNWNGYRGSPAGGSFHTARDLNKFLEALRQNKLLNKEYTELFFSPQISTSELENSKYKTYYGFGWEGYYNGKFDILSKDGGTWGFNSRISIVPEKNINVIVLSNYAGTALIMSDYITDIVLNADIDIIN